MSAVLAVVLALLAALCWLGGRSRAVDWGPAWVNCLDGLNRLFCRHYHGLVYDPPALPESGPALLVSNHVSGLDPLLMIAASRRPLRFLIAREEYERFGLTWLFRAVGCIPVDRSGRPEQALRAALKALQAGEVVALFPHGRIHLDTDPPRRLKRGAAWLAGRAACPVVPVRVAGIRGQGHVLLAPLIPGRARLQASAPIECTGLGPEACLERIATVLDGRGD